MKSTIQTVICERCKCQHQWRYVSVNIDWRGISDNSDHRLLNSWSLNIQQDWINIPLAILQQLLASVTRNQRRTQSGHWLHLPSAFSLKPSDLILYDCWGEWCAKKQQLETVNICCQTGSYKCFHCFPTLLIFFNSSAHCTHFIANINYNSFLNCTKVPATMGLLTMSALREGSLHPTYIYTYVSVQ